MNGNLHARRNLTLGCVDGSLEFSEPQRVERSLEFSSGEVWQQHRGVLVHSLLEESRIEVVAVQVGDIQEIWIADIVHDVLWQVIIAREDKPRTEECGYEPWVAHNRDAARANEYSRVAKRDGLHVNYFG